MKVTRSSGNVFRDLGFSAEESERLLVRADLLLQLQKTLTARGLTPRRSSRRALLFSTSCRSRARRTDPLVNVTAGGSSVRAARRQDGIALDDHGVRAVLETAVVRADFDGVRARNLMESGAVRRRHWQRAVPAVHHAGAFDARSAFLEFGHRTSPSLRFVL
jgi:hypothetical protein